MPDQFLFRSLHLEVDPFSLIFILFYSSFDQLCALLISMLHFWVRFIRANRVLMHMHLESSTMVMSSLVRGTDSYPSWCWTAAHEFIEQVHRRGTKLIPQISQLLVPYPERLKSLLSFLLYNSGTFETILRFSKFKITTHIANFSNSDHPTTPKDTISN
jgi:hypothetical protein